MKRSFMLLAALDLRHAARLLLIGFTLCVLGTVEATAGAAEGTCNPLASEAFFHVFPDTHSPPHNTTGVSIYKASTGDFIGGGQVSSEAGTCWRWDYTGDSGGVDFSCEVGIPPCDDVAFVIRFGTKSFLLAPRQASPPGSFYSPHALGTSGDFYFPFFLASGGNRVSEFGFDDDPSDDSYYEEILGSDYAIPYNRDIYCAWRGCSTGGPQDPGTFLATIEISLPLPGSQASIDSVIPIITFSDAVYPAGNPADVIVRSTWPAQDWDLADLELRFPADVQLVVRTPLTVDGTLGEEPTLLTERTDSQGTGTGWGGILVRGNNGKVNFDGVIVEHADVGIEIRSTGNVIRNTLFDQNGVGILADFLLRNGLIPGLSWFHLRESCVTNSVFDDVAGLEGYGIWGRYTNALVVNSTVEDNDAYGVFFDRADLIIAHGLLVTGNGNSGSGFKDGVRSGPFADITLASPMGGSGFDVGPERNSIHDNDRHEISIEEDGFVTAGAECVSGPCPSGNRVSESGFPGDTDFLIENLPDDEIPAQRVYWDATASELQQDAFADEKLVDYSKTLPSDPASDAGRSAGCERETFLMGGSSSARGSSSSFLADIGEQSRGMDAQTRAELIERIRSMRQALIRNPAADTAEALLGRLYGLQRLDREDELGEHAATMGVLSSIRAHLLGGQQLPTTLRATAEAALVAGVHDLMRREQYEQVEQTVQLFSSQVEHENTMVALAITDVSLTELEGDYASAIVKYHAIIESLGPDREQLAHDLEATIALLQRRLGEENGPEGTPGLGLVAADAPAEAESSDIEGFRLEAAYPNPFNPSTVVPFVLDAPSIVSIAVYDILGRQVALLTDGRVEAGRHEAIFDGTELPSGAYLVRATMQPENGAAVHTYTQRITLLK